MEPREIHAEYLGAMLARDADRFADLFALDGVFEAPLVPPGGAIPRRVAGREEIRKALTDHYRRSTAVLREVNKERSRRILHTTSDPEVFIAELDVVFGSPCDGPDDAAVMSLVQIFRTRQGHITLMRDYFTAEATASSS
ncbi:nuclear transport factor 2 family protein [Streptomyces orinoci]|uniref:Nuclear transport factor 2 family protein n=1 Tax=Streptomyces orinoci TaxID=67339 RepID=A0ABV3K506_STRON|nr:nuclear transport factor 2 family protein [Streptomyces orinoci]